MVTPKNLSPDARSNVLTHRSLVTKSTGLASTPIYISNARRVRPRRISIRVVQAFATNPCTVNLTSASGLNFGAFVIPANATANQLLTFENFLVNEMPAGDVLLISQNSAADNGTYYLSVEVYPFDDNNRGV